MENRKGMWIPIHILSDKNLDPTDKMLLTEVLSLCDNGTCFASDNHYARLLNISQPAVNKRLKSLVKRGYIVSDIKYSGGKKVGKVLKVNNNQGYNKKEVNNNQCYNDNNLDTFNNNQGYNPIITRVITNNNQGYINNTVTNSGDNNTDINTTNNTGQSDSIEFLDSYFPNKGLIKIFPLNKQKYDYSDDEYISSVKKYIPNIVEFMDNPDKLKQDYYSNKFRTLCNQIKTNNTLKTQESWKQY